MGKIADHLKTVHEHLVGHHSELAKSYHELSSLGKAAKSKMRDEEIVSDKITQCLGKIAATHQATAQFHKDMMGESSKVTGDELSKNGSDLVKRLEILESTIIPTKVSAITPNAPGVTAVPRAGQRAFSEKPNVPVAFEKLVAIET